jgi:hypothetical protein
MYAVVAVIVILMAEFTRAVNVPAVELTPSTDVIGVVAGGGVSGP